jgi:hypothetical protein
MYITMHGSEWLDLGGSTSEHRSVPWRFEFPTRPWHGNNSIFFFQTASNPEELHMQKRRVQATPPIFKCHGIYYNKCNGTVFVAGLWCDGFIQFPSSLQRQSQHLENTCLYAVYNCNLKLIRRESSFLLSCSICLTNIMSHDSYRPTNGVTSWRYPRNTHSEVSLTADTPACCTYITGNLWSLHYQGAGMA